MISKSFDRENKNIVQMSRAIMGHTHHERMSYICKLFENHNKKQEEARNIMGMIAK